MNKTDIEWADYTWNPVTGCLHDCPYCYARRIAYRFGLDFAPKMDDPNFHGCKYDSPEGLDTMAALDEPYRKNGKIQPYPMAFYPTFHRYKLGDPEKKADPLTIFVSSMGDLFGEWVPTEWIREVFDACDKASQHRYLFLTKNPAGIEKAIDYYAGEDRGSEDSYEFFDNMWFGTTVTSQDDAGRIDQITDIEEGHRFLSIEPLLGPITLDIKKDRCPICGSNGIFQDNPATAMGLPPFYCDCCAEWESETGEDRRPSIDWVIIGAESGNRSGKVVPRREWIESIVNECRSAGVPVFMKDSIAGIIGPDNMLRQIPEGIELPTKGGATNGH